MNRRPELQGGVIGSSGRRHIACGYTGLMHRATVLFAHVSRR